MMEKLNLQMLGDLRRTGNKDQVRFQECPFCSNTKFKFYVNLKKGLYYCHRCGVGGRIKTFQSPLDKFKERVSNFLRPGIKVVIKKDPEIMLPKEIIYPIYPKHGMPYRYLERRQITREEQVRYRIGYCSSGNFEDRIILPVYDNGVLVYFMGRSFTDREPRYMNSPTSKEHVIFKSFEGKVGHAVVVEGVFSALRVAKVFPAIALLGKIMSPGQRERIKECTDSITIMLDPDAQRNAVDLAWDMSYHIKTWISLLEGERDPGEMSTEEINTIINSRKKETSGCVSSNP